MSHLSVYKVKEVHITQEALQLAVNIVAAYLKSLGYKNITIKTNTKVYAAGISSQKVDYAIFGTGDPVLERGIGFGLKSDGTPYVIADFWRSKLEHIAKTFSDIALASDYATATVNADPDFEVVSAEIGDKTVNIMEAQVGGATW